MTPQRRDSLLAGQTHIAQKVYWYVTNDTTSYSGVTDIAAAMKVATGAGVDIHILRGCLAALKVSGLIRELVPGSYRRITIKEKKDSPVMKVIQNVSISEAVKVDDEKLTPFDRLGDLSARLRAVAGSLAQLADDIDAVAISVEDQKGTVEQELAKLRQFKNLLKELT